MGMGWNWVSVLTGLDSMSDKSSKLTLQFAGGDIGGQRSQGDSQIRASQPQYCGSQLPGQASCITLPLQGVTQSCLSLQGPPGKGISQGTLVTAPLKLRCFPGLPAPSTKYLPFDPPQGLPVQSPSSEIAL